MILVEKHIITKSNSNWKSIDYFSFISKNLYNQAIYYVKQQYQETGKFLRYYDIEKHFRKDDNENYCKLPNNTSQQILRVFDKNMKSYFSLLKKWKQNKKNLNGCPKFPKYKHKEKGRNILLFTSNQFSLKNGYIHLPKKMNMKPIKTKVKEDIKQIRIIPQTSCYVLEVIYEYKKENKSNVDYTNYLSIDLGVNNICAMITNQPGINPILINGKQIKSFNAYFNKLLAKEKSQLIKTNKQLTSNKIKRMWFYRQNWINNYLHHVSKQIITFCIRNEIGNIVIGKNKEWKQNINIGKKNNQNFCMIPFNILIKQITYKAEKQNINVILQEESYTSKCDALSLESICKHEKYSGKRIKRGLFKSSNTNLINADINGAINILRKVIGDDFVKNLFNKGCGYQPVKVNFNRYVQGQSCI